LATRRRGGTRCGLRGLAEREVTEREDRGGVRANRVDADPIAQLLQSFDLLVCLDEEALNRKGVSDQSRSSEATNSPRRSDAVETWISWNLTGDMRIG